MAWARISKAYMDGKFRGLFVSVTDDIALRVKQMIDKRGSQDLTAINEKLDRIWKNMPRSTKRSRAGRDRKRERVAPDFETSRPESRQTRPEPPADEQFQREVIKALEATQQSVIALANRLNAIEGSRPIEPSNDQQTLDLLRAANSFPIASH